MATTELSRLPGLEVVTEHAQPAPGHFIERGPQKRLMVFSGRSHPDLAQRIAEKLGVELGAVELRTFANDETYCRYEESIRGADVFIVQPTCGNPATGISTNDALMEMLVMVDAAVGGSAEEPSREPHQQPCSVLTRSDSQHGQRRPLSGDRTLP